MKKSKKKEEKKLKETEEIKNQLVRALADYDNLRKRVETDVDEGIKRIKKRLLSNMLSVFDMLEDVQEHVNDAGLAIAINEFRDTLKEEGAQEVKAGKGDEFDEDSFEAVETIKTKDKKKKGKVAEMVLTGWRYKDGSIIRPVKVKVYK
ncbi:MAG: nucleotide exchange factor GrpE [Candidatus Woesebacteria bacterium]|jgi:molecular chaperone GrpE